MTRSVFAWLWAASTLVLGGRLFARPEPKLRSIFWFKALIHWRQLAGWHRSPALPIHQELQRQPQLLGVLIWPLLDLRWHSAQRLRALEQHFAAIDALGDALALWVDECRQLIGLDEVHSGLSLVLERPDFLGREGQLALSLFFEGERLYSIAFLLDRTGATLTAYVGAIQGAKQSPGSNLYRGLTKSAFGLRPRDLVLALFLVFCAELGVTRVNAVQDQFRQHNHRYHGRHGCCKIFTDYDAVWQEHGGVLSDDGFYALEPGLRTKPLELVPTRKRAMYRKRYEFLQSVRQRWRDLLAGRVQTGSLCLLLAWQLGETMLELAV